MTKKEPGPGETFGTTHTCGSPKCGHPSEVRFVGRLHLCNACFSLITEQEPGGGPFTARCKKLRKIFGLPLEPTTTKLVNTGWGRYETQNSTDPVRNLADGDGDSVPAARKKRGKTVRAIPAADPVREVDVLGNALHKGAAALEDFDPFK